MPLKINIFIFSYDGTNIGTTCIGRDIREYQIENQVVLPYRGTIHDIGRAVTHKKIIIGYYLKNVPTPDISRMTDHTEEACDRYIKAFKKVKTLYGSMNFQEIARTLEMSEYLVKEYIAIIEEYNVCLSLYKYCAQLPMVFFKNFTFP